MIRKTYPVFVDQKTATALGITEHPGRPTHEDGKPLGGEGVFVGFTPETTTYEMSDWQTLTAGQRALILDTANRQIVQDSKNAYRADVKDGGQKSLKAQIQTAMDERESVIAKLATGDTTVFPELQAANARIAELQAKLKK